YDLLLYRAFVSVRPPEETGRTPGVGHPVSDTPCQALLAQNRCQRINENRLARRRSQQLRVPAFHAGAAPSGSEVTDPAGDAAGVTVAAGRGLGSTGLCGAAPGSRSVSSRSAQAKKSSFEIFPASTSASSDRCALYSRFSMPALLCSMRHALRRSTQKSTSCRDSARYSTSPAAP